jgi:hypothetical protein
MTTASLQLQKSDATNYVPWTRGVLLLIDELVEIHVVKAGEECGACVVLDVRRQLGPGLAASTPTEASAAMDSAMDMIAYMYSAASSDLRIEASQLFAWTSWIEYLMPSPAAAGHLLANLELESFTFTQLVAVGAVTSAMERVVAACARPELVPELFAGVSVHDVATRWMIVRTLAALEDAPQGEDIEWPMHLPQLVWVSSAGHARASTVHVPVAVWLENHIHNMFPVPLILRIPVSMIMADGHVPSFAHVPEVAGLARAPGCFIAGGWPARLGSALCARQARRHAEQTRPERARQGLAQGGERGQGAQSEAHCRREEGRESDSKHDEHDHEPFADMDVWGPRAPFGASASTDVLPLICNDLYPGCERVVIVDSVSRTVVFDNKPERRLRATGMLPRVSFLENAVAEAAAQGFPPEATTAFFDLCHVQAFVLADGCLYASARALWSWHTNMATTTGRRRSVALYRIHKACEVHGYGNLAALLLNAPHEVPVDSLDAEQAATVRAESANARVQYMQRQEVKECTEHEAWLRATSTCPKVAGDHENMHAALEELPLVDVEYFNMAGVSGVVGVTEEDGTIVQPSTARGMFEVVWRSMLRTPRRVVCPLERQEFRFGLVILNEFPAELVNMGMDEFPAEPVNMSNVKLMAILLPEEEERWRQTVHSMQPLLQGRNILVPMIRGHGNAVCFELAPSVVIDDRDWHTMRDTRQAVVLSARSTSRELVDLGFSATLVWHGFLNFACMCYEVKDVVRNTRLYFIPEDRWVRAGVAGHTSDEDDSNNNRSGLLFAE